MTRVFVSAGEPSGDIHAAAAVAALREAREDTQFDGIGGPQLAAAGVRLLGGIDRLSVVGLTEAVSALPRHVQLLRLARHQFQRVRYDVALLVDYPGFHLRLAGIAASKGIPVVYYIAPQVWAWGRWRLGAMRRSVRHLAVILPFEEEFFSQQGIPSTYVGHPLLDRPPPPTRERARAVLGLPEELPVLAVFPGSRSTEIRRLWPVFRETALRIRRRLPELGVLVAAAPPAVRDRRIGFRFVEGSAGLILAAADASICKSGTTTLEAALTGTPMAVAYRMSRLSYAVARLAVRVPHVSLVNLVAGKEVVPEYLQHNAEPGQLERAVVPLLERSGQAGRLQCEALARVRGALGAPGAAQRVAEITLRHVA